ncbi:MAG: hypothetical protein F083_890 [bacterium F083]|nr:MAG: hypothetical protein F083_890 [bacterium F083]
MKHNFRILIGVLAIALPMSINAQVKPVKPNQEPKQAKVEKVDKEKLEKEKLEKQERREKQKGGLEMPRISGFVQGMYQANLSDEGELKDNTLRMRRVRLSVDGNLSKTVSYKIQGDFTRSPMLVDAFIKYKPCREFAIQVGQFKTPFTIESPINPVNLEIFDYGEAVQQLGGYKDVCGVGALGRDLGVMATGSLFPVEGEEGYKYSIVDYSIGVFNGNGANQLDNNNRKDIVGRLEVHPGLKALTLSGSYYYGMYRNTTVEDEIAANGVARGKTVFPNGVRNRWAAGIQYNDDKLVLRGEYISGQTDCKIGGLDEQGDALILDQILNSKGYYAVAGYNFAIGKDKSQRLMPVLRYEHFDQVNSALLENTNWYTVGINYWPLKSVNCKLDYSLIQKEAGGNSHRVVAMVSYKF